MRNPTQQALLSDDEIKQLIKQAGKSVSSLKQKQQFSNAGEYSAYSLGSGMDFADRRPYEAGDDPRFIDWRASARNSQILIRRFYAEQAKPSCLLIDRGSSMLFGTKNRLKLTQALHCGIFLGAQMLHSGQQLACYIAEPKFYWQAANNSIAQFTHSMRHACRPYPADFQHQPMNWSRASDFLLQKLPQGSHLMLISDFQQLQNNRILLALSQHFDLTLVCISDETEHSGVKQSVNLYAHQQPIKKSTDSSTQLAIQNFQLQLLQRLTRLNAKLLHVKTDDDILCLTQG